MHILLPLLLSTQQPTPFVAEAFAPTVSPPVSFPPLLAGTPLVKANDIQQRTIGNNREHGSDLNDIAVSFSRRSGEESDVDDDVNIDINSIIHMGQGLYEVRYTPTISGHYDAAITIGGEDIMSTDLSEGLFVRPARPSAIHSMHTANLLATAGVKEDITVQAVDRFGNKLLSSLSSLQDEFLANIDGTPHLCSGQASDEGVSFHVDLEYDDDDDDGGGGLYTASYTPSLAGTHQVSTRLRSSGGLLATYYKTTDFTQEVLDSGEPWCKPAIVECDSTRLDSDLMFDWGFASPPMPSGQEFPIDSFSVRWVGELRVPSTDEYTFSITLNGKARLVIGDATVIDTITTPSPLRTITGDNALELEDSSFYAITIEYVHYTDEALFQLQWSSWSSLDGKDSRQQQPIPSSALYYTRHVGNALSSQEEDDDYLSSPIAVEVVPGAIDVTSSATTSPDGDNDAAAADDDDDNDNDDSNGLNTCVATTECSFVVQTKDSAGNHRYNDGTDPAFEISMVGTGGWAAQGRVNDDLSYSSDPLEVSALTVTAQDWQFLDNVEVTHGSTVVTTSKDLLSYLNRGDTVVLAGQMYNVSSGGGTFDASTVPLDKAVLGPSMTSVALYKASSNCGTGKHVVRYSPVVRGQYEIDIKLPPIPQVQRVETYVSPYSALSGSFVLAFRSPDGVVHTTDDIPYNADANELKEILDDLPNLAGAGAEVNVDVNEYSCTVDGDATSGCSWDVTFVGSSGDASSNKNFDMLMASWDNLVGDDGSVMVRGLNAGVPAQSIDGFPRTINVVPHVIDPSWSTAHGKGLAAATAGVKAEFSVQAKDGAGNDQLSSVDNPDDILLATIAPEEDDSNGAIIIGTVTAESDGRYKVRYTPRTSGYHTIRVEMKSVGGDDDGEAPQDIGSSPFRALVSPAEPSAPHSAAFDSPGVLHHEGLSKGVYKANTNFAIQLRDQYDNKVSEGPLPEIQIIEITSTSPLGGTFDIGYDDSSVTLPAGSGIAVVEEAIQSLPGIGAVTVTTNAAKDIVPNDVTTGSSKTVAVTRGLDTVTPSQRLDDVFQVGDWIRIGDQNTGPVFTVVAMSTALPFTIKLSCPYMGESSPATTIFGQSLSSGGGDDWYGFQYIVSFESALDDLKALDVDGSNLVGEEASIHITACDHTDDEESECPSSPEWNTQSQAGRRGQEFVIELTGPEHVQGQVTYVADGRYAASYVAPRVGEYQLDVRTAIAGGLKGNYFNNRWLYGSPIMTRIDEFIDFVWTDADPITKAGKDFVSVRWTGYTKPSYNEIYTFRIRVNDGARLWVGGTLIIDEFDSVVHEDESSSLFDEYEGNTTWPMIAGRLTTIKVEYQERRGAASLRLEWMSQSQPWSVIDSHRLYHAGNHVDSSPYTIHTQAIVPSEPTNCSVSVTGATSLRVTWMGPNDDGGEDVDSFNIVIVDDEDIDSIVVISDEIVSVQDLQFDDVNSVYSHDVSDGLVAGKQYGAQVSAGNSQGSGTQCLIVYATPMSEPMAVPVSSVVLERHETTPTSLVVRFAALTDDQSNGYEVLSYIIEWSTDPLFAVVGTADSVAIDVGELSVVSNDDDDDDGGDSFLIYAYEIEGLEPGTEYYARIIARNGVGAGPSSSTPKALAPGSNPDPIEQNSFILEVIHADHHHHDSRGDDDDDDDNDDDGSDTGAGGQGVSVGESSTSLVASWPATAMTNDNGFPILGYVLEYFATGIAEGATPKMHRLDIDVEMQNNNNEIQQRNNYTLTDMTPGEAISATISARNALGHSTPTASVPDELAPPRQRPSEPSSVHLIRDSGRSLHVSFTAPESDGGDLIAQYRIEYDPLPSFDSRDGSPLGFYNKLSSQCDPVRLCEHTILGLTEGVEYHVRVFAGNSYGFGIPSLSQPRAVAPVNPPSPPESVVIQHAGSSGSDSRASTAIDVAFSPSPSLSTSNVTQYKIEWNAVDLYQPHTVQRIAITDDGTGSGTGIGGTFKLGYESHFTKPLTADSSAHQIKVAIETLATVGSVSVARESLPNGYAWFVTFPGFTDMEKVEIQSSSLTGSDVDALVDITVSAYDGFEIQSISCEGCLHSSNGFRMSYLGNATTQLSASATPKQMKDALQGIGLGQVMVSRSTRKNVKGYEWRITFLSLLGDLSLLKPVYDPHQDIQINVAEHSKGKLPEMDGDQYGSMMVDADANEDNGWMKHRVEKLKRGMSYYVQVSGYNEVGFGPSMYSAPSTVTI